MLGTIESIAFIVNYQFTQYMRAFPNASQLIPRSGLGGSENCTVTLNSSDKRHKSRSKSSCRVCKDLRQKTDRVDLCLPLHIALFQLLLVAQYLSVWFSIKPRKENKEKVGHSKVHKLK